MRFTTLLTSVVAGLAVASPTARSDQSSTAVQQRGVLVELCMAGCMFAFCSTTPPACAACLVECLGTADDEGPVVLDPVALDTAFVEKVEGYTSHVAQA